MNELTDMEVHLISRQAAIDVLKERLRANGYSNVALVSELNRSIGYLMRLPTVDAVPVRHGEWIAHTMSEITGYDPALSGDDPVCTYSCSVCGEDCYVSDTGDDILSNYCPNCGARMDKG